MAELTSVRAVKRACRQGLRPDERPVVWARLLQLLTDKSSEARRALYKAALTGALGADRKLPPTEEIPTFGGDPPPSTPMKRVYCALYHQVHADFAPQVQFAAEMLITHLSEADAFCFLLHMLQVSKRDRFYFPLCHEGDLAFVLAFKDMARRRVGSAITPALASTAPPAESVFALWFRTLFRGFLPRSEAFSVFDCFLVEGFKILLRFGMALLAHCKDVIVAAKTPDEVWPAVHELVVSRKLSFSGVRKTGFKFLNFSRTEINRMFDGATTEAREMSRALPPPTHHHALPPAEVLADGKHVSKLLGTGSAPAWLRTLPLPAPCLHMNLRLVYSTEWHGWGLDRLYRRCGMAEPLLLLVKTPAGQQFGAFISEYVRPSRHAFGSGECFLFSVHPRATAFRWVHAQPASFSLSTIAAGASHSASQLLAPDYWAAPHRSSSATALDVVSPGRRSVDSAASSSSLPVRAAGDGDAAVVMCTADFLAVGVSPGSSRVGLRLFADLSRGESDRCAPFDNQPLHLVGAPDAAGVDTARFEVGTVEVLAFVPSY